MTGNKEPSRPEGAEGLEEILALLREIRAAIVRLPEVQAAVFFQMKDEYEAARFRGKQASDLWDVTPPSER